MGDGDSKQNPEAVPAMPELMTVPELAECLNVSTITIYRLLKAGQLPAFRVGSDWRFSADAIAQLDEGTGAGYAFREAAETRKLRAMNSQNDAAMTLAIVLLGVAAAFFLWILFTKV